MQVGHRHGGRQIARRRRWRGHCNLGPSQLCCICCFPHILLRGAVLVRVSSPHQHERAPEGGQARTQPPIGRKKGRLLLEPCLPILRRPQVASHTEAEPVHHYASHDVHLRGRGGHCEPKAWLPYVGAGTIEPCVAIGAHVDAIAQSNAAHRAAENVHAVLEGCHRVVGALVEVWRNCLRPVATIRGVEHVSEERVIRVAA
mmetsp:Transcript_3134/g.9665  ORF Transcript_3134/g.9665 Transcript_3134/m.9665 type:complete len:201 (+) Transcript_3134:2173-2775(+)